jgi:hypothetical protein
MVYVDEFLGTFDARLRATLAVLRVGKLDFYAREFETVERPLNLFDGEPRRLVPRLSVGRGVTGQSREHAIFQAERNICRETCLRRDHEDRRRGCHEHHRFTHGLPPVARPPTRH